MLAWEQGTLRAEEEGGEEEEDEEEQGEEVVVVVVEEEEEGGGRRFSAPTCPSCFETSKCVYACADNRPMLLSRPCPRPRIHPIPCAPGTWSTEAQS